MIERTQNALRVVSPMVMSSADALLDAGRAAFQRSREIVDLSGVSETDSSALAVVLEWLRQAKAEQRSLLFINMPATMRALAQLYGVDDILPVA